MSGSKEMGNATSDPLWTKTYSEIKNRHDEAFLAIDQAISLEEHEKPNEALEKYKEGIKLIDEALAIQVQCPENPDLTWEKACVMIQKIKKTRAEVLTRITTIQRAPNFVPTTPEDPPSYEEAIGSSSSSTSEVPRTYKDLASALNELSIDPNQHMAEQVVCVYDGVRLYFISPNGEVVSTQEPQTLKISLVEGNEPNTPKAILQIGTWVYPLVPGVSPCYRTDYGAFILPNVYAEVPGSSIGIILPSDADEDVFDLLESILHGIVSQVPEEQIRAEKRRKEEPADISSQISHKLVDGAWYISQGLVKGAEKAGEFFNTSTPKLINNMTPPERPAHIPSNLSKGMQIASTATSKAAQVTGFVADKVGIATVRLGQFLAPHIQKQGTRLLTTGFNMSEEEASDRMKGILTVAAGAVEGFSTVYRGLETSASILGHSLKNNTVKIVEHKYGQPASTFTGDTLSTVGNVYNISQNTKIITPKGIVKHTAKSTGTAMVHPYTSSCRASTSYQNNMGAGREVSSTVSVVNSISSSSLSKDVGKNEK